MNPESKLEQKLKKQVELRGGKCIKLNPVADRGIPDRLVLLPGGRAFFVELKTDTGQASVHQTRWQKSLYTLGFKSLIIYGEGGLNNFLGNYVSDSIQKDQQPDS